MFDSMYVLKYRWHFNNDLLDRTKKCMFKLSLCMIIIICYCYRIKYENILEILVYFW